MIKINSKDIVITLEEYERNKINLEDNILNINDYFRYKKKKNTKKIFTIKFTSDIKENVKKLRKLKNLVEMQLHFGIDYNGYNLIGIIDKSNKEIETCIKTIFIKDRDERYEYLYDSICEELDEKWSETNLCEFKNNTCIEERQCAKIPRINGCCYAFWYSKNLLGIEGIHQCEFLDSEKHCTNKNAACKIFVCPYLKKKKNFKIDIKKMILIQVFLNSYQKLVLKENFFVSKEEFIEKLKKEEKRIIPFWLYYSNRDYMVYKYAPKDKKEVVKKYNKIYKKTKGLRNFYN